MKSTHMQSNQLVNFLYTLVLPMLVGLAAFSSKERFPDYQLTQFFSWSLLLASGVIFIKNFKHKKSALMIFLMNILTRFILLLLPNSLFFLYLSNSLFAIIIIFAGASIFLEKPMLLLRQMYWLSIISIIMSLLQINGVRWAQEFGSAFEWKRTSDIPILFVQYSSDLWVGLCQMRPDGLTHANNLTSQLLMLFYAYIIFFYTFENNFQKIPAKILFITSFACALNGGKVIVLGIFSIFLFLLFFTLNNNGRKFLRAFAITFSGYLLYFTLYPGLFILNFNYTLFLTNAIGRVLNLSNLSNIPGIEYFAEFLTGFSNEKYQSYEVQAQQFQLAKNLTESISGLSRLIAYSPFVLLFVIIGYFLLKKNLWRVDKLHLNNMRIFLSIMGIALVASIFGGPFFSTVWFVFFISFVLTPMSLSLMTKRFLQSVSR